MIGHCTWGFDVESEGALCFGRLVLSCWLRIGIMVWSIWDNRLGGSNC